MPNNFDLFRLRNFFNPQEFDQQDVMWNDPFPNSPTGQSPQQSPIYNPYPESSSPEDEEIKQLMNRMYQPKNEMTDRFNEMISNIPQREKPSKLRRLAAIFTGMTVDDPDIADKVINAPYYRKIQDWKLKLDPTYQAANLERQGNINERQLAYQTAQSETARRRAETGEKAQEERERTNRANEATRQKRAEIYDFKTRNPNYVFKTREDGQLIGVNPQHPDQIVDTGLKTGDLSDTDKITLGVSGRLKEIEKRGDVEAGLEGLKQEGRVKLEEKKSTLKGGTKGELPSQTRVRQFNKAREAYNLHPEWRKFIKIGSPGTSDFEITPPGKSFFGQWKTGPDDAAYKNMSDFIYEKKMEDTKQAQTQVLTKTQTNTKTGAKRTLISTDNGKTWKEQ